MRESVLAKFDENRGAVGMLNLLRDRNEGKHREGEGKTPVTIACTEGWEVKAMVKKSTYNTGCHGGLVVNVECEAVRTEGPTTAIQGCLWFCSSHSTRCLTDALRVAVAPNSCLLAGCLLHEGAR